MTTCNLRTVSGYDAFAPIYDALGDVAGLETETLDGWFDRGPFDEVSRDFVWIARKPG